MPITKYPLLLALDPGTKEMGIALLEGYDLIDYRVRTFRNGRKPHALLGQAKRAMDRLLKEARPEVVVIEKPFFARTRRSALLTFLVDELRGRVAAGKVSLREYSPRSVRTILLDDPKATKRDIARFVSGRFPELRQHFHPKDHWKERYWSHVFDAVALALAELAARQRTSRH
jgi:Holliday junction resolvasome RuvABC endonuclease subunit